MGNEKINFSKKKLKKFFRSILLTGLRVKKPLSYLLEPVGELKKKVKSEAKNWLRNHSFTSDFPIFYKLNLILLNNFKTIQQNLTKFFVELNKML